MILKSEDVRKIKLGKKKSFVFETLHDAKKAQINAYRDSSYHGYKIRTSIDAKTKTLTIYKISIDGQ